MRVDFRSFALLAALAVGLGWAGRSAADDGRRDVVLTDGWTADGEPVTLPHTWNAIDAEDGPEGGCLASGRHSVGRGWTSVPSTNRLDRKGSDLDNSANASCYRRKAVAYRHPLPDPDPLRRYFVRCEGASIRSTVTVNGRVAGRHAGATTAFAFEITGLLRKEGNVLEILVDNYYDPEVVPISGDYSVPGGLYRAVHLVDTPAICFDPVSPGFGPGLEIAADAQTGVVKVTPSLSFAPGTETNAVRVTYAVLGTDIVSSVPAFAVPSFRLWSPETPHVYRLQATVESAFGRDVVVVPFGFRTAELRPDGFYLNGVRRKLKGVNLHQDALGKGWAISEDDKRQSIEMIKKMGADAVRTAHYPHSESLYDLCDARGLVAWVEVPVSEVVGTGSMYRAHAIATAREMVAQCRHHPSVALWSIANEVRAGAADGGEPATLAVLRELRAAVEAADPSRPVVQANFLIGQTNLNAITDHFGLNTYPGWYWATSDRLGREIDSFLARNPKFKTLAISEYGAGASVDQHENPVRTMMSEPSGTWHPEEYQTRHHVLHYRVIREDPRLWGSFAWQMFDSAADVRTDGPVSGINDKGLVCRDHRTPKDAYWLYKANWNPEPLLHLCGKRMTVTTNAVSEVVAFSNCGRVTLKVNGKAVGSRDPDAVRCVRWPSVSLSPGVNEIRVEAGRFVETCVWTLRE